MINRFRPESHSDVIDALDLAGRRCPNCGKFWISLHGTVWLCPNDGGVLDRPAGIADVLEQTLTTVDDVPPTEEPKGGQR